MTQSRSYGRTRDGVEVTDELIERYVAEAEQGLDVDRLRPRRPLGTRSQRLREVSTSVED